MNDIDLINRVLYLKEVKRTGKLTEEEVIEYRELSKVYNFNEFKKLCNRMCTIGGLYHDDKFNENSFFAVIQKIEEPIDIEVMYESLGCDEGRVSGQLNVVIKF